MRHEVEQIETLRPDGRKGVTIAKDIYQKLYMFILSTLDTDEEITLNDLLDRAEQHAAGSRHDIPWVTLQIKLDLEARGLIKVYTPIHQKRLLYIRITRDGQKKIRLDKQLAEWNLN